MPYTPPTRDDLTARFPEFTDQDPGLIDRVIADAMLFVSPQTWNETDYAPAILFLAAHLLDQVNSSASAGGGGGTTGAAETYLKSVRFADRSVTYDLVSQKQQAAPLATTEALADTYYGGLYLLLLRRNAPPVLIV